MSAGAEDYLVDNPTGIAVAVAVESSGSSRSLQRNSSCRSCAAVSAATISSYLYDMIREGSPPLEIAAHVAAHPDDAYYRASHNGRNPLHEASRISARRDVIAALLNANPFAATETDNFGNTPLHLLFVEATETQFTAAEADMEGIVEDVLSVNPKAIAIEANNNCSTPLHMACQQETISPSIVLRLLAANPECATMVDATSRTALHIYCQAGGASVDVAEFLLDYHPEAVHILDDTGSCPLHYSAHSLKTEMVRFLLEYAPSTAYIADTQHERTAFHILCIHRLMFEHQRLEAVLLLLKVAPETAALPDGLHSCTPLHYACRNTRPSLELIEAITLTHPISASIADGDGYLPLHCACETGAEVGIITCLLSIYPEAASVLTKKQDTALHLACDANASSSVETVRLLMEANDEALSTTNDYGYTPLHTVCHAYQPRVGIIEAILSSSLDSIAIKTNGGETPLHLACNAGASVEVLQLLTKARKQVELDSAEPDAVSQMTNKAGNTPLHEASFRGASLDHIATLAISNPEWIDTRNKAGHMPLQIICKRGLREGRIIEIFSKMRGADIFSVVDDSGHTLLHSSCREGTDAQAIKSLIDAYPAALRAKTAFGDQPLHLACLRSAGAEVVGAVAEASMDGFDSSAVAEASMDGFDSSSILFPNSAGQTPLGIVMGEFRSVCVGSGSFFCCVTGQYSAPQERAYEVLATLIKVHYYGTAGDFLADGTTRTSLVHACLSLYQQGIRVDPAFIRRSIRRQAQEVGRKDRNGDLPLHIEAGISVTSIMEGESRLQGCCDGSCHGRIGILDELLKCYPDAVKEQSAKGEFPLDLMIKSGRRWNASFKSVLMGFPPALHWHKGMDDRLLPQILAKVGRECGVGTLFELLRSRPDIARTE